MAKVCQRMIENQLSIVSECQVKCFCRVFAEFLRILMIKHLFLCLLLSLCVVVVVIYNLIHRQHV